MKDKEEWLMIDDEELRDKKLQMSFKRDLLKALVARIYEIGAKRAKHLNVKTLSADRVDSFYEKLETSTRAVAFLKYKWGMTSTEIESTLKISRVEMIEKIHQTRFTLMNHPPKMDQLSL